MADRNEWKDSIRFGLGMMTEPTMLLYTFPVLFMAVVASVYLHLRKKTNQNRDEGDKEARNDNFSVWRRPVIIKGLGIVTKIELAFFVMFIALLVWSFVTYLHVSFANITHKTAAKKGEEIWESKLDSVALRFGLVGNLCLAFLFFPVTRFSSMLSLFGRLKINKFHFTYRDTSQWTLGPVTVGWLACPVAHVLTY